MSRHPGQAGVHQVRFNAGGLRSARDESSKPDGAAIEGEDRAVLLASVARDARLDRKYLLLITLSAGISTLGLLQNSPAVVIGAMLVSPLLGPIMGIGFGLATLDSALIRRALGTLAAGVGMAVIVAMLLVWVSPIQDVTGELRARTQPTLLDLGVAVVGGLAGVYAIFRRLSGVMVGVAIATALVPPLCTIGFGIATARPEMALGAALLFLTNSLAIAIAATLIARVNRFGPSLTPKHTAFQVMGIVVTLGLLSIPLALSLNAIVRELTARSTVQAELTMLMGENDRVDTLSVVMEGSEVKVDGVVLVERFRPDLAQALSQRAGTLLKRPVEVNIAQLQPQSPTAVRSQNLFNQRLTALERREREENELYTALTRDMAIPEDRIVIDGRAKRVIVLADQPSPSLPADEGETESDPLAAALGELQARFGDWRIERRFTSAAPSL